MNAVTHLIYLLPVGYESRMAYDLSFGLGLLLRLALTLGFLFRALFQGPLGFLDPSQSRLPSRQLRWQFISCLIPSIARILFCIRGLGLLQ